MSFEFRRYGVHPDDSDVNKPRPDHTTRQNRAGEHFHTYVNPDLCPAWARADELLWQLDRAREAA